MYIDSKYFDMPSLLMKRLNITFFLSFTPISVPCFQTCSVLQSQNIEHIMFSPFVCSSQSSEFVMLTGHIITSGFNNVHIYKLRDVLRALNTGSPVHFLGNIIQR